MKDNNKALVVNYISKRSMVFVEKLVEEICKKHLVVAVVSSNMMNIEKWRTIKGIKLIEIDGYTTVGSILPKLFKYVCSEKPRVSSILKKYNIERTFIPINTYWAWLIDKSMKKVPLTYMMHDPINHRSSNLIMRFFNRRLAHRAENIIILSDAFKNYVSNSFRISEDRIFVVRVGSENIVPKKKQIHLIKYKDENVNFVFQGQIEKYKGLSILGEAYRLLTNEYDNVTLTVAGKGNFSDYVTQYSGLRNFTLINRWLSDEEVSGLFNDKNVIAVLPYLDATQSGVINVAMPAGAPVIATRCGGIPEQIENNINGFLVDPGDVIGLYEKMKYVVDNINNLDIIRNNAYKRMDNLSWDKVAEKVLKAL